MKLANGLSGPSASLQFKFSPSLTQCHLVTVVSADLTPPVAFSFQAYGSGCDVVILASDFECVQIIPGAQNGNIQVGCVECSHQLGRVSVDCTHTQFCFMYSVDSYTEHKGGHWVLKMLLPYTACALLFTPPWSPALHHTPPPLLWEWLCRSTDGVRSVVMMNTALYFQIAASYGNTVCIFEPISTNPNKRHKVSTKASLLDCLLDCMNQCSINPRTLGFGSFGFFLR